MARVSISEAARLKVSRPTIYKITLGLSYTSVVAREGY
jgi:hypothetical protein